MIPGSEIKTDLPEHPTEGKRQALSQACCDSVSGFALKV